MTLIRYTRKCQPTVIDGITGSVVTYTGDLKLRSINHGEWVPTTAKHRKWFMDKHLEECLNFIDPTP